MGLWRGKYCTVRSLWDVSEAEYPKPFYNEIEYIVSLPARTMRHLSVCVFVYVYVCVHIRAPRFICMEAKNQSPVSSTLFFEAGFLIRI